MTSNYYDESDVPEDWEPPVYGNYEPLYFEDTEFDMPAFEDFNNVFSGNYFEPGSLI